MKSKATKMIALAAMGGFLVAGCRTPNHVVMTERVAVKTSPTVMVSQAPPPPRQEIIGPAPSPKYTWVAGYWAWQGRRYIWVPGHWELTPRTGAVWVPGHWDHNSNGWRWVPGYWQ